MTEHDIELLPITIDGADCEARIDKDVLEHADWTKLDLQEDDRFFQGLSITAWLAAVKQAIDLRKQGESKS